MTEVEQSADPSVVVEIGPIQQISVSTSAPQQVVASSPATINVETQSQQRVDVQELGIIGQQGPPGPPGTSFAVTYVLTSVSSWSQAHDFSYYPSVRLIESLGDEVETNIEYPDAHTVYIEFPMPFTGTVILS